MSIPIVSKTLSVEKPLLVVRFVTGDWSYGGKPKDYSAHTNVEFYWVYANPYDVNEAVKAAQQFRRLTPAQRNLMYELKKEFSVNNRPSVDTELSGDFYKSKRTLNSLAKKGYISIIDNGSIELEQSGVNYINELL